jgi:hypothetical protein
MTEDLNKRWKDLIINLSKRFESQMDMQAIIFLVGLQETGKFKKKLNKDQKLDVMHVAICRLLSSYGYYEFMGRDEDGWPHWRLKEQMPALSPFEQDRLMRQAILDYFENTP